MVVVLGIVYENMIVHFPVGASVFARLNLEFAFGSTKCIDYTMTKTIFQCVFHYHHQLH